MKLKHNKSKKPDPRCHESEGMIDVELTDEEFCILAKGAHERGITFNHFCERLLVNYIMDHKGDSEEPKRTPYDDALDEVRAIEGICDGCGDYPHPNVNCDPAEALKWASTHSTTGKPKKRRK
jgi:hypothetical protein